MVLTPQEETILRDTFSKMTKEQIIDQYIALKKLFIVERRKNGKRPAHLA